MNKRIKIGQLGFGRTGRAVASVLLESEKTDLKWVLRKTKKLEHRSVSEFLGIPSDGQGLIYSTEEFTASQILDAMPVDVIVDFSSEDGIEYYGEEIKKRGITLITAVSSYPTEKLEYIKELSKYTRVISSPNITLGVNFLMIAAKILKKIAPYTDVEIIEEHFRQKPEISGTAKILANALELDEGNIKSIRAGGIIGVHEILFGFPYQTVRLKHESISREAFGNGILFALENLPKEKTGLFTMEDLMLPHFNLGMC
jgi:4-hydroxy-tetrahydrodipicolinate reductase